MNEYQWIIGLLNFLFPTGVGILGTILVFILILFLFPEKIEKWQEIIWGWTEKFGLFYKKANKKKIAHSIQSRVMMFARNLGNNLPDFEPPSVNIEWFDETINKEAFLENGDAVIRLRRQDPNNENVATACMLYVSDILLRKTRRYLSPTQKDSVELFIGYRILHDDEEAMDSFVDKWLFPGIEQGNKKISDYFNRYKSIDETGFFMPVFLQELIYLGNKVFGRQRDDKLIQEVDGALEFLEVYSERIVGERTDRPYFEGEFCRFGIMIVGISVNVDEERHDIYIDHINKKLLPCGVETIYLIGPAKNRKFMKRIAVNVGANFSIPFEQQYKTEIRYSDGRRIPATNYIIVMRNTEVERYIN